MFYFQELGGSKRYLSSSEQDKIRFTNYGPGLSMAKLDLFFNPTSQTTGTIKHINEDENLDIICLEYRIQNNDIIISSVDSDVHWTTNLTGKYYLLCQKFCIK